LLEAQGAHVLVFLAEKTNHQGDQLVTALLLGLQRRGPRTKYGHTDHPAQ
jgi:hypothetical protein